MSSKIEICNRALVHLGQKRIDAITEESAEARVLNEVYDSVRREVLRRHSWIFALKTTALAELSTTPHHYSVAYQKPSDCLRIFSIFNTGSSPVKYDLLADEIHTDISEAYILYVRDEDDTAKFDPSFVTAFSYKLATEICLSVTGKQNLQQLMEQRYDKSVFDAMAYDANLYFDDDTNVFLTARQ